MNNFQVRVENLVGTKEKYEYDEAAGEMRLDFVFKDSLLWPYHYGEILNTLGGDGDKLDAIILPAKPLKIGEIISCRAVGMAEVIDRGEEDNKIICVPVEDITTDHVDKEFEETITGFLTEVARQKNKVMKIVGFYGSQRAAEEVNEAKI